MLPNTVNFAFPTPKLEGAVEDTQIQYAKFCCDVPQGNTTEFLNASGWHEFWWTEANWSIVWTLTNASECRSGNQSVEWLVDSSGPYTLED